MTLAEIAADLGVDERTIRRDLESALAKLHAGGEEIGDPLLFSVAIFALVTIPRRFSAIAIEGENHASRAAPPPSPPDSTGSQRAVQLLPRRFPRRTP